MPDITDLMVFIDQEYESSNDSDIEDDNHFFEHDDDEMINDHIEMMHVVSPLEMVTKKYYIGCYANIPPDPYTLILASTIHRNTFMEFTEAQLSKYFFEYSVLWLPEKPSTNILQLFIEPVEGIVDAGLYTVVVKTYWIKCIQWAWKRLYKKRQIYISYKKRLSTIHRNQISTVKLPPIGITYPSIRGLLRNYFDKSHILFS